MNPPNTADEAPGPGSQSRRTDRVSINLPVQVSGQDVNGDAFTDKTHTVVVSRHGAAIVLKRMLVAGQELRLLCSPTGKETLVRVVDQAGTGPDGYHYGVEILDPEVDLWELVFPPLSAGDQAAARILLECERCHANELSYLNVYDLEVFQAHGALARACKACANTTIWKQSTAGSTLDLAPAPVPEPPPAPLRSQNTRGEARVAVNTEACIRHPQQGEEIVKTLNASRSGLCFKSTKTYEPGTVVEVALPYSRKAGNIFTSAKIEHAEPLAGQAIIIYGASYVRNSAGLRQDLERTPY